MAPDLALGGLQHWLQGVIVHPGTVDAALGARESARLVPPARLERVVRPSPSQTARERVGVYHGMYRLRMAEALEGDYPGLAHFLGERRWPALVREYVTAHPSTSYTLNHLGRHLPGWLRGRGNVPSGGFCQDLARLEWAVAESFDAEEAPRLDAREIEELPADEWPRVKLVPSPSLRLLELAWNAAEWLDTAKDERHAHPRPRRGAAYVVVFRREYAVYHSRVSRPAFRLLSDLAAGDRVGRAIARALESVDAPEPEVLGEWFRRWAADGVFTAMERGRRRAPGTLTRPGCGTRAPASRGRARPSVSPRARE